MTLLLAAASQQYLFEEANVVESCSWLISTTGMYLGVCAGNELTARPLEVKVRPGPAGWSE